MSKFIKISVSLLACFFVFLTGCGTPSTSLPSALRAANTNYPSTINILAPNFFSGSGDSVKQDKQQWIDEMSARYGVQFNILSNDNTDPNNRVTSATDQLNGLLQGDTTYKGLFTIYNYGSNNSSLKRYLQNDSILPLEDYLKDNPAWNALPDDFKSLFEIDGHIYAIPTSSTQIKYARIIHNDALEKTGIAVTDLKSFHDFAVSYSQKTGNPVIGCTNVNSMIDILNAFGLYPAQSGPFGYDPTDGCFEDWMTKGAAIDALEYLRDLYQAGAIYISYTEDAKKFNSGLVASEYQQYGNYANCTEVLTLNPEYPQIANPVSYGFAMTKDTPQPKETINLLVNMLFGSEQNYLECWLGSSANYTQNSDGTITVKLIQDSDGKYEVPGRPNLTGTLPGIFPYSDADILYSQNGVVQTASKADTGSGSANSTQQNSASKNESFINVPVLFQNMRSATYDSNRMAVIRLYMNCFQKAVANKDETVQQVIDDYKKAMLDMGGNTMLDEMNSGVGKKTAYYYG